MLSNSQAEEYVSEEEGEKRGHTYLLTKPESKVKSRQENLRGEEWEPDVKAGLLATGPHGDDGKWMQSPK